MPPKVKTWELRWPSMGVARRQVHERVAAAVSYSTPWAMNCRLEDSLTNRLRGGSFTAIDAGDREDLVYRDRLLTIDGNVIQVSRQGDHSNFDYSKDISDIMRATRFQLSEAGEIGDDVVALIPHKDSFLLGFTAGETWVQRGDPLTGSQRNISREIGIIASGAWCTDHDTAYFLSSRGLYSVSVDGSGLKALSEGKIPEDLVGLEDDDCTLTYNHADRGVYIHLSEGVSWFYSTEGDQFWPFDLDTTDNHVLIGPLRIGGPNLFGIIQTLHGMMAADSATVRWRIVAGNTAEEVCDNGKAAITAALDGSSFDEYYDASGAWEAGRSHTAWPRVRAPWAILWLSSSDSWAYEGITMESAPFGKWR